MMKGVGSSCQSWWGWGLGCQCGRGRFIVSGLLSGRLWMVKRAVVVLVAVVGWVGVARGEGAAKQPNVVFLLADQWRAQATGYAGDPNVKTPNLNRLEG